TVIAALSLAALGVTGAVVAAVAGTLSAGALAAFSGFCKAKWNTNELITTFLFSCAVIPVINYFVTGPFLDSETSLLSTAKITQNMRLSLVLKPSGLSSGIIIAFILVIIVWFFLKKTKTGYEFRMAGFNEMFARYGGIDTKRNMVIALALSGCLYGLAGSVAVLGTHYSVIKEFSSGLGWSGLTVALIAGFSPAAVVPCAVFLAWINAGARTAMQNTGLTFEVAYIVQAVIFFLSTAVFVKKGKR
ncbi:MAG: ABC transporter permease, partial [Treponema sp.]|nr:ABC transporter permease [Treponema sp.]